MDVPPLLGESLVGREFVVVEWVDEGESSPALIEALHEPGALEDLHGLFRRFDSELLA